MKIRSLIQRLLTQEDLNFLLTNRLPRRWLTQLVGRVSQIEQPLVARASIAVWRYFSDLDLGEAKAQQFASMHACFTRELKEGARVIDTRAEVMSSPSDGIVGAHGRIEDGQVFQAKGFPYSLADLLGPHTPTAEWRDGYFVTLRLTSSMYHRFHAPLAGTVEKLRYFSGDTWNVNPIALKRVEKLFCKNERACIEYRVGGDGPARGQRLALVPVAAILVASIRLHFYDVLLHMRYAGPREVDCDAAFAKGQEMGWFQHGSTIIVLAPKGFALCDGLAEGQGVRMGQALMQWRG